MSEEILINVTPQETRVAVLYLGVVQELHIERAGSRGLVGNVYLGKVCRVLPGMQSAFIDIGLDRAAFLHVGDIVEARGDGPVAYASLAGFVARTRVSREITENLVRLGAFDALGVDYFVGGSVASSVFGEPRQTLDADLVARLLGQHAKPLVENLSQEFYADLPAIEAAVRMQSSFNLIHLETVTKVDVFVRWRDPFGQSQFARRQKKSVGQTSSLELFFSSAEDTVLAKLEWYRKGGGVSDKQWRDLLGVLKVQGRALDRSYLTEWATTLGVGDLLTRALNEADLL